ncbi:hypothetical protein EVG20_g7372 [Dentipellis fragilis]|uniref:Uncharacterized protein n=1 Tax=Dentipellis fragilis TaxID=205917 RepID=A0A4Y9YDH0_9AGAM|nr:hypothetical protein EVG20_g7372 [Dentipellis fragilis]
MSSSKSRGSLKSNRSEPYAAAASLRKSKMFAVTPSSEASDDPSNSNNTPPSLALSSASTNLRKHETFREFCIRFNHEFYPQITPRDDYELRMLTDGEFKKDGTNEEFYDFVRRQSHEASLDEQGNAELMAKRRAKVKARLDGPSYVAGAKPFPGQDTVKTRPIPNSPYSLRLWPTGNPVFNIWAIDFVRTETGDVVVTPPNFALSIVPDLDAPWLPCSGMEMRPIWHAWGKMPESITPVMETYLAPAGASCRVARSGQRDVLFKLPVPPQPASTSHKDADILDFD